ncbi:MAG: hypothetical protein IPO69_04505 [Saprospiraceae bacterium]|nr:hypothetical protein [Saprospiraceae bacterium]
MASMRGSVTIRTRITGSYTIRISWQFCEKDCEVKGPWLCKESSIGWYANLQRLYGGARVLGSNGYYAGSTFPQTHLYNECMVQVLVDDKQAPVVAGLQDITVYCDGAPGGSAWLKNLLFRK